VIDVFTELCYRYVVCCRSLWDCHSCSCHM